MTTPPTIQTNPLDPVFSGVPVIIPQGDLVNPTWNKWFVDLREKVNVINSTLAAWSGITPVTGLTPGTYGDTTHYPVVTVNEFGLITGIAEQTVSGGGGSPMKITTVSGDHTISPVDAPTTSANVGWLEEIGAGTNLITVDLNSNQNCPIGTDIYIREVQGGTTTIQSVPGVTLTGPSISDGGDYSIGRLVQLSLNNWAVSGNIPYLSGLNPNAVSIWNKLYIWFAMQETAVSSGSILTDSFSAKTATVTSSGLTSISGHVQSNAIYSSGSSRAQSSFSIPSGLTSFSVVSWMLQSASGGTSRYAINTWSTSGFMIGSGSSSVANYRILSSLGYTTINTNSSGITVDDGNWHFVVWEWTSGSSPSLYIDDMVTPNFSGTSGTGTLSTGTNFAMFDQTGGGGAWAGGLEQVAFLTGALTLAERNYLYNSGIGVSFNKLKIDSGH